MNSNESSPGEQTLAVQRCLSLLQSGDASVRGELLQLTQERLLRLTAKMKQGFQGVARWEQTEDVFQNASLRLYQAMSDVRINDVRHFFRLAALQIRRELLDLCRHHGGQQAHGANHATLPPDQEPAASPVVGAPDRRESGTLDLHAWTEFHESVDSLPAREREVFDLLYYHEMKQEEAAELLSVSTRSIKRLWRSARLLLHQRLSEEASETIGWRRDEG